MFIIAIISEKGGTGKTTATVALATLAASVGEEVLILDADKQGNATGWGERREGENPLVLKVPRGRMRQAIEAAREDGNDLVLIDTPGKNDDLAIEAARLADVVLIPCRPLIFDMETLPTARNFVRAAGDPPAFVLYNCVPPQGHQLIDKLKGLTFAQYDLQPCPVHLTQRAIHGNAQALGKGVTEVEPDNHASAELKDLYLFLKSATKHGDQDGKKHKRTV